MLNRASRTARRVQLTRARIYQSIINALLIGCCQGHLGHSARAYHGVIWLCLWQLIKYWELLGVHWYFIGHLNSRLRFNLPERFSLWRDILLSRKIRCAYHKNANKLLVFSKRKKRQPCGYDLPPWLHVLLLTAVSFLKKLQVGLRRLFCIVVKTTRISAQPTYLPT